MTNRILVQVRLIPICLVGLAVVAPGLVGCGGKVCPEGTIRVGDYCKRVDPDVDVIPDVIITPDLPTDQGGNDSVTDVARQDVTDTVETDETIADVPPDDTGNVVYPGGYVGKPCEKPSACRATGQPDGLCLSWPKGFCAMPGCSAGVVCPEGTACMNLAAGTDGAVCAVECQDDSDCRTDKDILGNGYACKLIPDPVGAFKSICYMENVNPMHVSGPCVVHEDCADGMGCLPNFDGGYCAVLDCASDSECPDGTRCTRLQGHGVCLKSCVTGDDCAETRPCTESDIDCVDGVALSRACIQMKDVSMDKFMVCGSGTVGKEIGEQCLNETECASGMCNVSYTGKCTDFAWTGRRCSTHEDCAITGARCNESSAETYGFCTASCGTTMCTADQSVCVMSLGDSGTLAGLCLPPCTPTNPEDPLSESDCWEEAGLRCMWGDSKFQPGVRSCVRIDPGDPGMSCLNDEACYSGQCIGEGDGIEGTCTMQCLTDDLCPFPTICQTVGETRLCMKRCQSTPDCPGTMTCKVQTMGDYCVPASM